MPSRKNIARARASRGAAWLDEKLGRGWRRKIRRRRLDMGQGIIMDALDCGCILAQLDFTHSGDGIGTYERGLEYLGLTFEEAESFGFDDFYGGDGGGWEDLTEAWREELRRAEP